MERQPEIISRKPLVTSKWHTRATYGHAVKNTYISQKQSYYKIELRCEFNYGMHRAHVRYRKTAVLHQKNGVDLSS